MMFRIWSEENNAVNRVTNLVYSIYVMGGLDENNGL